MHIFNIFPLTSVFFSRGRVPVTLYQCFLTGGQDPHKHLQDKPERVVIKRIEKPLLLCTPMFILRLLLLDFCSFFSGELLNQLVRLVKTFNFTKVSVFPFIPEVKMSEIVWSA